MSKYGSEIIYKYVVNCLIPFNALRDSSHVGGALSECIVRDVPALILYVVCYVDRLKSVVDVPFGQNVTKERRITVYHPEKHKKVCALDADRHCFIAFYWLNDRILR